MSNTEASELEWGDLGAHVRQENQGTVHPNANAFSSASGVMVQGLPYEHLFDKAVTPSDVGKLNRLVIPKQHAEKHFPLDINSIKKGSILNFEDYTGKIWGFRYSHWSSSQSYVLTKGWTRFVKDKKLAAGDIVSFYRESAQPHHLYISWTRRPSARPIRPQSHQSKRGVVYPDKGSSSLSPFNSGSQITVDYNAEWMSDFWPSSSNCDAFAQLNSQSISRPLVNKVCHVDALLSQSPVTPNGALPLSVPLTKQTDQGSFYEIDPDRLPAMELHLNLQNSLNSRNESTSIKRLVPFVNPAGPTSAQESGRPEQKASSSLHLATRKGVRLFGVTLAEPQRLSAQYHGQLNLFPR